MEATKNYDFELPTYEEDADLFRQYLSANIRNYLYGRSEDYCIYNIGSTIEKHRPHSIQSIKIMHNESVLGRIWFMDSIYDQRVPNACDIFTQYCEKISYQEFTKSEYTSYSAIVFCRNYFRMNILIKESYDGILESHKQLGNYIDTCGYYSYNNEKVYSVCDTLGATQLKEVINYFGRATL